MKATLRIVGTVLLLAVLGSLILLIARPSLRPPKILAIELVAAAWLVFGCAAWLVRGMTVRLAVGLILTGGIAFQVIALAGPPQNSSDLYRYIWDGRVQAAGIDPYMYPPGAAGVAQLRDPLLWRAAKEGHYVDCVPSQPDPSDPSNALVPGCTKMNRPTVPTVYPPVAEAYFFAVHLTAPADNSTTPVQAAAAFFAVLITVLLLYGLRSFGKDLRLAALWAWCPVVPLEAAQNGHVDVVGVAFTLAALLLFARARTEGRVITGAVLLGLGIATKVTPVLVAPAVLRRGWRVIPAAVLATISVVYAPHVFAVGRKIIGFFPGYLKQEGYSTGSGFSVIGLVAHGKAATVIAVLILGAIALAIYRYGDPGQPWRGGVLMTSAALAVCTPHFQWYTILLVMLVALDDRPEWLAIAAGGYLTNSPQLRLHGIIVPDPRLAGYGSGAAIACALALTRYLVTRRARARARALATGPEPAAAPVPTAAPVPVPVPVPVAAAVAAAAAAGSRAEPTADGDPSPGTGAAAERVPGEDAAPPTEYLLAD